MTDEYRFDPKAFQAAGFTAIDAIGDYFTNVSAQPVRPRVSRAEMFSRFESSLSDEGIGIEQAVREVAATVFGNSMAMSHPLYLGLVNSSPLPAALIGDLFVSAIDNNNGAFHQGPVIAATEREVIRAVQGLVGYDGQGLLLPGGSYVNFHALQLARTHHFPQWHVHGPTAVDGTPRIYVSRAAHFSVHRAVSALGLGLKSIAEVDVDARGAMNVEDLAKQIQLDRRNGCLPFAIVASAGTTGTGAIDDLASIGAVGRSESLWVHVDACYGGAAILVPELRGLFDGLGEVDSIAIDLHKWFFMPLTAGVVLTSHHQAVVDSYDVNASYIPDSGFIDPYRRGLPTSRRGCGLTVWLAVRAEGWGTIRATVAQNVTLTRYLESRLDERGFHVLPDGRLSIACARWQPSGLSDAATDELQEKIAEAVRARGTAWFATTRHADQTWLRFNMVNLYTRQTHIDTLVDVLHEVARVQASRCNSPP